MLEGNLQCARKHSLILPDVLELVSSSDNLPCASSIVVAAVIGNDSTAADEVVVLVEEEAGPGELARAALPVLQPADRPGEGAGAALREPGAQRLPAALPPHLPGHTQYQPGE